MAASQDKVQGILETLLEDSLPLVNKGIFTREQLRQAMCIREKHQNSMLKSTFKLSDYLSAIEYEYSLQRLRRYRISKQAQKSKGDIHYKKEAKTDFVIVKRIIRIWDRTMHKFKYNVELWKQYLQFCITISSKKHFFKALAHATRFLPFTLQLWKIGVQYLIEVEKNWWKARNLCHRALNINKKKIELWLYMFEMEIQFMKNINKYSTSIEGKSQGLNMIMPKQENNIDEQVMEQVEQVQQNKININEYDSILQQLISNSIQKCKQDNPIYIVDKYRQILCSKLQEENQKIVNKILGKVLKKLNSSSQHNIKEEKEQANQININVNTMNYSHKCIYYLKHIQQLHKHQLFTTNNKSIDNIVNTFINKPQYLTQILNTLLDINNAQTIKYINRKFNKVNIPQPTIIKLLQQYNDKWEQSTHQFISKTIKKIRTQAYAHNPKLLTSVIYYHKSQQQHQLNNKIYRSLSILTRNQPQIAQRCLHMIQNDQHL